MLTAAAEPQEQEKFNDVELHDVDLESTDQKQAPTEAKAGEPEDWTEWEERLQKEYGVLNEGKANTWSGYGVWSCLKVVNVLDFVGEVVIEFLGLNQSKYQYVIDAHNRHQRELEAEKKQQERDALKRAELEAQMLANMEGGSRADHVANQATPKVVLSAADSETA